VFIVDSSLNSLSVIYFVEKFGKSGSSRKIVNLEPYSSKFISALGESIKNFANS